MLAASLPRPGRALKAVLVTIAAFAVAGGIVANWVPGGPTGMKLWSFLAMQPDLILVRPWTLLTSGLVTDPTGIGHAIWALLGLYFLGPDLESRWGGARFIRFLIASLLFGNVAVLLVGLVPGAPEAVHPAMVYGPLAAVEACAFAWGRENAHRQMRFMFFLTMTGRTFMWISLASAVVALVFLRGIAEGAVAPLGGIAAAYLLSGQPSPVRSAWLRVKLALLRRRGRTVSPDILAGLDTKPRSPKRAARTSGPTLRVVQGGGGDDKKPPKDKRYLN